MIVERALAGKRVVRFKGGDNFVFGRGYEEVIACRAAGVPVTVIPGLTSAVAVPAVAGIPITHRGVAHEFTVVSGHLPPGHPESLTEWSAVAQLRGTLVLMMAVENAPHIAAALLAGGRAAETPVAVGLRRHDAGGADRALDAGHAGRRPRGRRGGAAGDHRRRERWWRSPTPSASPDGGAGRASTTRPTRGSRTTATCATSSCASTSRPSTACSSPRARRSSAARVEAGYAPRSFLMAPRWLDALADVLAGVDAPCYVVSEAMAEEVTGFHVHRGALASLERLPLPSVESVLAGARSVLVLEDIVDHTNVGAIFRSGPPWASTPSCSRPAAPTRCTAARSRSAMGAVFTMPWTRLPDWSDALPQLAGSGFTTVALTLADDACRSRTRWPASSGWRWCSAARGTGSPARWEQSADRRAIIPMAAGIDSLNVAAATAVACYVAARR